MREHLADFDTLPWTDAGEGIRFKLCKKDGSTVRLMELTDAYTDADWCVHGHMAYILAGCFDVHFPDGHSERFTQGDTVLIPSGAEHRHIACVPKGERLKMLSFEMD